MTAQNKQANSTFLTLSNRYHSLQRKDLQINSSHLQVANKLCVRVRVRTRASVRLSRKSLRTNLNLNRNGHQFRGKTVRTCALLWEGTI